MTSVERCLSAPSPGCPRSRRTPIDIWASATSRVTAPISVRSARHRRRSSRPKRPLAGPPRWQRLGVYVGVGFVALVGICQILGSTFAAIGGVVIPDVPVQGTR